MQQRPADKKSDTAIVSTNTDEKARSLQDGQIAKTIQAWMVLRLSKVLKIKPNDIDVGLPLTSYGLDSLMAFTLTGDLAGWLGHALPATLFWDHPTIEALAQHLAEKVVRGESTAMLYDTMAGILEEIEGLSEKEAQRRLAEKNKP